MATFSKLKRLDSGKLIWINHLNWNQKLNEIHLLSQQITDIFTFWRLLLLFFDFEKEQFESKYFCIYFSLILKRNSNWRVHDQSVQSSRSFYSTYRRKSGQQ